MGVSPKAKASQRASSGSPKAKAKQRASSGSPKAKSKSASIVEDPALEPPETNDGNKTGKVSGRGGGKGQGKGAEAKAVSPKAKAKQRASSAEGYRAAFIDVGDSQSRAVKEEGRTPNPPQLGSSWDVLGECLY